MIIWKCCIVGNGWQWTKRKSNNGSSTVHTTHKICYWETQRNPLSPISQATSISNMWNFFVSLKGPHPYGNSSLIHEMQVCNMWRYSQIHKITKFEMNNENGTSNLFHQKGRGRKDTHRRVIKFLRGVLHCIIFRASFGWGGRDICDF